MKKMTPVQIAGQIVATGALLATVAYFASAPGYRYFGPQESLVKVSIIHASQRREACRQRTKEELEALPPNMRAARQCSRERVPLLVEVDVDGKRALTTVAKPAGLASDLSATVYQLFRVPAGGHRIAVRMRDSARTEGYDYAAEQALDLKPHQVLIVDFDADAQAFRFR